MRVRRRLWLKVWVALLLTLFASIVFMWAGGGMLSSLVETQPDRGLALARLLGDSLPSDASAVPGALEERASGLGLRLALYDSAGSLLGTTDPHLPGPDAWSEGGRWIHVSHGPPVVGATLSDGRMLIGGPVRGWGRASRLHLLLPFGLLAFLGLVSLPLARRITGRLERLQAGVETLASGDLSARVQVEGSDEVARLAASFNMAAVRIEELMARQQRMLASASHELRSPLARLRVAMELMSDPLTGLTHERRDELLVRARSDVSELDDLIEDLLLVGRLGASDSEARRRDPLDLYLLAAEEAARFGIEVDGAESPLRGDERALRRMLRNLLENAEKHAGGEQIEVDVTQVGDVVRLAVADRGPGVPKDEQERIFEPFHRAPNHREGTDGGVGLGLSLVREIAIAHGGDARCEARSEGGSLFVVELRKETNDALPSNS